MHMEHDESLDHVTERRKHRTLSDGDVQAIAGAIVAATAEHPCRFAGMNPHDMSAAIEFYQKMNKILGDSTGVIWRTILVLTVTAVLGVFAYGFAAKIVGGK